MGSGIRRPCPPGSSGPEGENDSIDQIMQLLSSFERILCNIKHVFCTVKILFRDAEQFVRICSYLFEFTGIFQQNLSRICNILPGRGSCWMLGLFVFFASICFGFCILPGRGSS